MMQLLCNTDLFDTGGDSSSNDEEEPASHTGLTSVTEESGTAEMPPPSGKPRRRSKSGSYRKEHKEKVEPDSTPYSVTLHAYTVS